MRFSLILKSLELFFVSLLVLNITYLRLRRNILAICLSLQFGSVGDGLFCIFELIKHVICAKILNHAHELFDFRSDTLTVKYCHQIIY